MPVPVVNIPAARAPLPAVPEGRPARFRRAPLVGYDQAAVWLIAADSDLELDAAATVMLARARSLPLSASANLTAVIASHRVACSNDVGV